MVTIDAITRSVIVNNLQWATEEMNEYLARSAFSSNIKVRKDCSCALYDCQGNMLAQGTFVPVHLGIMSQTLKELLKIHPLDSLKEGDALIHNDPYMMGSHLWDVMIFKPVYYEGRLIAFTGCLAHQVDIGGSPVNYIVETIYEEGLRIPGVKILQEGVLQEDILRLITTNVRTAYEVKGDLMAELAANYRGEERIKALAGKYGVEKLLAYFDSIMEYSETGMRNAIKKLPNGELSFEDYLESDGINDVLIKLKVKISVEAEDIYVDFSGCDGPGAGGFNNPLSLTHSGVYYAIKAVLGTEVPANAGAYRAIHIIVPEKDNILNTQPPHAVGGCTSVAPQRIADIIIGAFAQIVPEQVCACDGHWAAACFGGIDPKSKRYFSYVETYGTGRGAKYNEDGASGHQSHMTNTANAPAEMIELEHPFRVEKYALVNDSGGVGEYRGGLGLVRELTCLTDMHVSLITSRPGIRPYGLFGGGGGATDCPLVRFPDGQEKRIKSERVPAGSKVIIQTSGGGGWGDPAKRDAQKLEWDVLNEYVSPETAKVKYGRAIAPETMKNID